MTQKRPFVGAAIGRPHNTPTAQQLKPVILRPVRTLVVRIRSLLRITDSHAPAAIGMTRRYDSCCDSRISSVIASRECGVAIRKYPL